MNQQQQCPGSNYIRWVRMGWMAINFIIKSNQQSSDEDDNDMNVNEYLTRHPDTYFLQEIEKLKLILSPYKCENNDHIKRNCERAKKIFQTLMNLYNKKYVHLMDTHKAKQYVKDKSFQRKALSLIKVWKKIIHLSYNYIPLKESKKYWKILRALVLTFCV